MTIHLRVATMKLMEQEVKKFPWIAACDERFCYYIVSARDEEQAVVALDSHKCPFHGRTDTIPDRGKMAAMWRELDSAVDGLMLAKAGNPPALDKVEYFRGRAHGLSTCLYMILGLPYFTEQADITREAMRRYKMRIGEIAWEPTVADGYDPLRDGATPNWAAVVNELRRKGSASRQGINPPPNLAPRQPRSPKRRTGSSMKDTPIMGAGPSVMVPSFAAIPGARRKLPSDVVAGIKNAISAGLDSQVIANLYQISTHDVDGFRE